jgi:hypothetical protein
VVVQAVWAQVAISLQMARADSLWQDAPCTVLATDCVKTTKKVPEMVIARILSDTFYQNIIVLDHDWKEVKKYKKLRAIEVTEVFIAQMQSQKHQVWGHPSTHLTREAVEERGVVSCQT